ncbi:MAG: histidine phosphatase family protein [Spirochaetaceae bacterium]
MVIRLLRHYKVKHEWKPTCTSKDFIEECKKYDENPVYLRDIQEETTSKVYISTLTRSYQTANSRYKNKDLHITKLLDEVKISPFTNTNINVPSPMWLLIGRLHWFLNLKSQQENRNHTYKRINSLINLIEKDNVDCILVGHGYHFYIMTKVLHKRNYTRKGSIRLKNGEFSEFYNN